MKEDSSSGPGDLPAGVILIQPLQEIEPADGNISMFHGKKFDSKSIEFVRMRMSQFTQLVSPSIRASDGKVSMKRIVEKPSLEHWLHKEDDRLAGFNFCKDEMANFTGRFYFTSTNGRSYELDRTHSYVQMKLYISLCRCKVDGVEERDMERRNIEAYIQTILDDDEPGIGSATHGRTHVVNEAQSKAQTKRYQYEKESGRTPAVDAWLEEEVIPGDRFVDELHDLTEDAKKNYISFTTPKKIVQALEGGHDNYLVDLDVPKYRGCIITDLQELADEMGFEEIAVLLNNMKGYFKTASCNPNLFRRGLKSGDVFIFHHNKFYGGEEGKAALKDVHMKITRVYENGKMKE